MCAIVAGTREGRGLVYEPGTAMALFLGRQGAGIHFKPLGSPVEAARRIEKGKSIFGIDGGEKSE